MPGLGSDESLGKFDGGDYCFDVKIGRQEVGIDDGGIEWIRAPEFDLSTCPENSEGSNNPVNRSRRLREVGEMRLVATVIQPPSGLVYPGAIHPVPQMN